MADVKITIGADSKEFQDGLKKAGEQVEQLDSKLGAISNAAKLEVLNQVAEKASQAFSFLTSQLQKAFEAQAESESATRRLTLAMQNQGLYSTELAKSYNDQAEALSELTGIGDDQITKGQAILQSLIGQKKITEEMTKAALDLGTVMGGDVSSGFEAVGRALEGNTRQLKQFGITIREGLSPQERQVEILTKINQKFGDTSIEANKGLGSLKGLHTAFDELYETIGKNFAPALTSAIRFVTDFVNSIRKNEELIKWISILGAAALAVTGLVTAISGIAAAVSAASGVLAILGTSFAVIGGPLAAVALSVGAIASGLAFMALNAGKAINPLEQVNQKIEETEKKMSRLKIRAVFDSDAEERLGRLKNELEGLQETKRKLESQANTPKTVQDQTKASLAKEEADNKALHERRMRDATEAHLEALKVKEENYSEDIQKLYQDRASTKAAIAQSTNEEEILLLQQHLETLDLMESEGKALKKEQDQVFLEEVLLYSEEFFQMSEEQQKLFYEENQARLLASIDDEKTARRKALNEKIKDDINRRNQFLQDEIKFGKAYAEINQVMHSSIYQGSKQAFGELAALTQSSNNTLKGIGKVAAIANVIIKTAESAMNIYAGFSVIPIIGPILGVAGAAAAVMFGAEQVQRISAAADGGIITGGVPGKDSVPAMLMPGELVVPTRNFSEVVNAVAAQRNRDEGLAGGPAPTGEAGMVSVAIGFDGNEAQNVLTARQVEARALGTLREG